MGLTRDILSAFRPASGRLYDSAQRPIDAMRSRVMLFYVGIPYPAFYALDLVMYRERWREFGLLRAALSTCSLLMLALSGRGIGERALRRAACTLAFAATLGVAFMCARTEGFASLYVVGMLLCYLAIAMIELFRPLTLACVLGTLSAAYFALNSVLPAQFDARNATAAAFFVLGATLFCVISAALLEKNRRELFAMNALLMRQNEDLERARAHQTQFLSMVSHELRSPVASVLGFVELIESRERDLSDKSRGHLQRIRESAHRLLQFINDLLDLSKAEAGRMEITLSEFDLVAVAQEVAEATRALVVNRDIQVEVVSPPSLSVRSDELRIRQILTNLTSNAAKFTESGRITIAVLDQQGVSIEVTDTGMGIPEDSRHAIFEAFRQAGVSTGGTGLGLSIVDHLVKLLHGRVELESELGRGSTFRVCLGPIAMEAAA